MGLLTWMPAFYHKGGAAQEEARPADSGDLPNAKEASPPSTGSASRGASTGTTHDDGGESLVRPPLGELWQDRCIPEEMLGPPCDHFAESLPCWSWESAKGQWKSYSLEESILLDRYWQVYLDALDRGSELCAARISLRREMFVNFADMTCQAGARPRSIRREEVHPGWLNNTYFFAAFTEALQEAGIDVKDRPEDIFDFSYNQDFRGMRDDGRKLYRGGQLYDLPVGWKRFAINVKGQYDDGDNSWLKEDDSGWAVAYHGTAPEGLPGILCTGFRVGDRQKFKGETGKGIYCTPSIDVAQHFSKPRCVRGHEVQIVLQVRVKPSAIRRVTDRRATDFEKKYYVINSPDDIRAYGVLIRELSLRDFVPPEIKVFGKGHEASKKALASIKREISRRSVEGTE